jgi:uncharacterized protein YecT (DUF1311 family)
VRRVLFIAIIVLIYSSATYSQKQHEMNKGVFKTFIKADKKLNGVYQQILKKYKARKIFIKNLRNAQRYWIKYRNAQFEMKYPESNGHYNRNTLTDSQAAYLTQLTEERTKTLLEILNPALVGLIAYYPFNGNARDTSGNGNHGVNNGAILTTDRFGRSNSAYLFSNCSSITIPELLSYSCSAFTFTAWVKQDYKDNNNHMIIFHGSKKGETLIGLTNNGILGFGVNLHVPGTPDNTQNWYIAYINDTLRANTYYFIVGRYIKGQKMDLLVNGDLVATIAVPNLNINTNPDRSNSAIGIHPQPGFTQSYCWNGVIDDILIYNRALSDDEVQTLYHANGWTENY